MTESREHEEAQINIRYTHIYTRIHTDRWNDESSVYLYMYIHIYMHMHAYVYILYMCRSSNIWWSEKFMFICTHRRMYMYTHTGNGVSPLINYICAYINAYVYILYIYTICIYKCMYICVERYTHVRWRARNDWSQGVWGGSDQNKYTPL